MRLQGGAYAITPEAPGFLSVPRSQIIEVADRGTLWAARGANFRLIRPERVIEYYGRANLEAQGEGVLFLHEVSGEVSSLPPGQTITVRIYRLPNETIPPEYRRDPIYRTSIPTQTLKEIPPVKPDLLVASMQVGNGFWAYRGTGLSLFSLVTAEPQSGLVDPVGYKVFIVSHLTSATRHGMDFLWTR